MKILVSGSICYDSIMDFPDYFKNHILPDKIHNLNVSFLVNDLKINYGGTAGNIAFNLALLGEQPIIISVAGQDFGDYQKWLQKNKINISGIKIIGKEMTAIAHIITDMGDNQITAFYPGAMKYPGVRIKKEQMKDTLAIISPGFIGDMVAYPKICQKNKIPYIFDPGQQIPALGREGLKKGITGAKILISNDYELSMIIDKTGWQESDIMEKVEILVTTLGEKGSVIKTKDQKFIIPSAKPLVVKDPTGAGDAYRAGFIKGLVNNWPLAKAGRLGALVAVYTVEAYGTQTHRFTWADIKKRYKENFGEELE